MKPIIENWALNTVRNPVWMSTAYKIGKVNNLLKEDINITRICFNRIWQRIYYNGFSKTRKTKRLKLGVLNGLQQ